jgi:cyclase
MRKRVIPLLTIENGKLIKTVKFNKKIYLGDPLNTIKIFNDKEVDELILLDIGVRKYNYSINYKLLKKIAEESFMPLTYGGGISNIDDARRIFEIGFEKISIQTAALNNSKLITDLSKEFGSQSIVCSIDIKLNWFNKYVLLNPHIKNKIKFHNSLIHDLENAGAGEIIFNCVDRDGTQSGPDLKFIDLLDEFNLPIIYVGGVSSISDIKSLFLVGIDAVAAGSFFTLQKPHNALLVKYLVDSEFQYLTKD